MNVTSTAVDCGTIEYPSLGCGGYLVHCGFSAGRVSATEVYTHNPGTCAPAGAIEAQCDARSMRWLWSGADFVRTVLRRL